MAARQVYRTLIALDIERFGRPDRNDQDRVRLRRDLHALLTSALTDAGIGASCWSATSTGDGLLAVVDPAAETARVLLAVLDPLAVRLAERNHTRGGGRTRGSSGTELAKRSASSIGNGAVGFSDRCVGTGPWRPRRGRRSRAAVQGLTEPGRVVWDAPLGHSVP